MSVWLRASDRQQATALQIDHYDLPRRPVEASARRLLPYKNLRAPPKLSQVMRAEQKLRTMKLQNQYDERGRGGHTQSRGRP